jgi:hypothetical protein
MQVLPDDAGILKKVFIPVLTADPPGEKITDGHPDIQNWQFFTDY